MAHAAPVLDVKNALSQVEAAHKAGKLNAGAVENIRAWLTEPRYAEYAPQVLEHIGGEKWKELDDVFWTIIPFGTGGRRGKMYPIGSNAINDRTIGESAAGLAAYTRDQHPPGTKLSCAIAYDTRHRSRHFAELCSEVMVAHGFTVYFLDGFRSTPELSYTVRFKKCDCGIMVTASHNPPSDNAVKAYWSTGGQLLPPHDQGVIDRVMSTTTIERVPFAEALKSGKVIYCQEEMDREYQQAVLGQSYPGPRELKIIYSPLHGVGGSSVMPVLAADGFKDVELFGPHAEPSGDFPNVPGHVSNPENPAVFESIIARAMETGAELVMASDPDADRMGAATPLSFGGQGVRGPWATLTGNQLGAMLCDYVLSERKRANKLRKGDFVVTTLVTTKLTERIAESYGVKTFGDNLVGFKYIAGAIEDNGPEHFLYGTEESYGYMAGPYNRDKDGAAAAMLMAELTARCKAEGKTAHEKLDALFWQYGVHAEETVSKFMPGSEGMGRMKALMARLRSDTPAKFGPFKVAQMRDYLEGVTRTPDGKTSKLVGPTGDLVILDFELAGNYVAVRPSGTEPKVKFYMFAYEPPEQIANLDDTKAELAERLKQMAKEMAALADSM